MAITLKKKGFFGGEKITCVDENAIVIDGKSYPLSQVLCAENHPDGNNIFFVSVGTKLDHDALVRIVEGLACGRPLADDKGAWMLPQRYSEFNHEMSKRFGDTYKNSFGIVNYDWQQEEGKRAFELICRRSRIAEVQEIYEEVRRTNPKVHWGARGEIRKHCNSCGAEYRFTAEDLKRFAKDAHASISASLLQVGGLMTGNYGAAVYGKQREHKVVDLNRCPFCDSSDIEDLSPGEKQPEQTRDGQANTAFSAADEILKFKNLADQGIITAEEFEAKKKQLLGL